MVERESFHHFDGIVAQSQFHQAGAITQSRRGNRLQVVVRQIHLHQVGQSFKSVFVHRFDTTFRQVEPLQVDQLFFHEKFLAKFAQIVVGEVENLCFRIDCVGDVGQTFRQAFRRSFSVFPFARAG